MDKQPRLRAVKQLIFSAMFFAFAACASLWEDYDKKIHENKEFDKEVQIKEIESTESAPDPSSTSSSTVGSVAKDNKKASVKNEKALKNKKGTKKSSVESVSGDSKESASVIQKHLPALEDGEGFNGRRPQEDPFVIGETLEFSVRYFKLEAGRFTMTTKPMVEVNGKKSYHFVYAARSSSVFSVFYAVDDRAETYMDYEDLVPYSYVISAKESKQVRDVKSYINHKTRKAKTWDKKIKKDKEPEIKEYEWDTEDFPQNVFSVAYYLRCFKLSVGKKLAVNVAHEGKNIIMRAEIVRTEKLSTPMGKLDTFVVKPSFEIDGVFKPVGDIFMWVTNDQHKRLVRIESKIKIGTIVAAIEKISP